MRILQISDSYPPSPGGLEQVVQRLATELAERGHDSQVATLALPGLAAESVEGQVTVHRVHGWTQKIARFGQAGTHLLHPTAPDWPLVHRLQDLVDRLQPDVIHVHGWIISSCTSLKLPAQTRLVTSLHDHGLVCAKKTLIYRDERDQQCSGPSLPKCISCANDFYGTVKGTALATGLRESRRRFNRIDRFLPITAAVGQAAQVAAPASKVTVVPPFVDDSVVEPGERPRPLGLPEGEFVLYVGALSEHKGVDLLIEAHRLLERKVPLVLIGHGDPQPWRELAAGADVRVLQYVPNEQVQGALRAATVAVMPSRWAEPFGLVAVEAMAAGTALVVTEMGSLPEIVGDAAVVVPPAPQLLAGAIDDLLSDPSRRAMLGHAGQRRAHWFTASAVVPRYVAAYESAKHSG